jgi:PAT family beta-lactamase induction signal transducer AmpG
MAKYIGWEGFFITCALVAIPGMLMLLKFAPWNEEASAGAEASGFGI